MNNHYGSIAYAGILLAFQQLCFIFVALHKFVNLQFIMIRVVYTWRPFNMCRCTLNRDNFCNIHCKRAVSNKIIVWYCLTLQSFNNLLWPWPIYQYMYCHAALLRALWTKYIMFQIYILIVPKKTFDICFPYILAYM